MNRLSALLFTFLFCQILTGQFIPEWEEKFGGDGDDEAKCIIETSDKGLIMAGCANWQGKKNAWLIKLDARGNALWGHTYEKSSSSFANAVIETEDGGLLMVGGTWTKKFPRYHDFWVVRLDSAGEQIWDKTYGGDLDDVAYDVLELFDGYVVAGYNSSDPEFGSDIWVIKIDKQGNLIWEKSFGGTKEEKGFSIIATRDNGFAVVGYTKSKGGVERSAWIVLLDENGDNYNDETFRAKTVTIVDEQEVVEECVMNVAIDVVQDEDGGFVIAGYRKSEGLINYDLYVIKTDEYLHLQWDTVFSDDNWGEATSITKTFDNCTAITGFSQTKTGERSDFWIMKLDSTGTVKWDTVFSRKSLDYAYSIIETYDKGYVVAGSSYAVAAVSWDYAILKFDNTNIPDELQVIFYDPFAFHTSSTEPKYTVKTCIHSLSRLKKIQVYVNDKLKIDNVLQTNHTIPAEFCENTLQFDLDLEVGRNTVRIVVINSEESVSSEEHSIYYIPYLLIDW